MSSIEELYEQYIGDRPVNLTLEQFTLFAEFFPALLIILSDGTLDEQERIYLAKLAKSLAQVFSEDGLGTKKIRELQAIFIREFEYLVKNLEFWQEKYISALKGHLKLYPESKATILDTLFLFANTSENSGEEENKMIQYLSEQLDLENELL